MPFRGLPGHTLLIKVTIRWGSCAHTHTLLDLTQNLLKILILEHKTDFSSVAAECRQPVAACGHAPKHPYSAEKLLGLGTGRARCHFATYVMCMALQLFWAAGQTEAMGMSTAVKEIKQLSTADADSSTPTTFRPCGCH